MLSRREVVFLPFRADDWDNLDRIWETAMEDEQCDVYVMPIPYYYKKYDGTLYHMQYHPEQYPEKLKIVDYQTFDLKKHHPDQIFFQNPYDEFHDSMSVPMQFYSAKLKDSCEELVYIPYFVLEEFSNANEREYFNMKYYCTVPGVVRADRVLLSSETMKELYVEKLTEFAGENTRLLWEEKIQVSNLPLWEKQKECSKEDMELPKEWEKLIFEKKEDGKKEKKKVMFFYTGVSTFVQYGEKMIEKIKRVLDIFWENREKIVLLWKPDPVVETVLKSYDYDLYKKYMQLVKDYRDAQWGILDDSKDEERAVRVCDAYYGDASALVQKFRNREVPVMILNVTV